MIFGIPITPPFYFLLNMTVAQVQLMAIDQSIIVYPKKHKIKMGNNREIEFDAPTQDDLRETADWWKRKQEQRKKKKNT